MASLTLAVVFQPLFFGLKLGICIFRYIYWFETWVSLFDETVAVAHSSLER